MHRCERAHISLYFSCMRGHAYLSLSVPMSYMRAPPHTAPCPVRLTDSPESAAGAPPPKSAAGLLLPALPLLCPAPPVCRCCCADAAAPLPALSCPPLRQVRRRDDGPRRQGRPSCRVTCMQDKHEHTRGHRHLCQAGVGPPAVVSEKRSCRRQGAAGSRLPRLVPQRARSAPCPRTCSGSAASTLLMLQGAACMLQRPCMLHSCPHAACWMRDAARVWPLGLWAAPTPFACVDRCGSCCRRTVCSRRRVCRHWYL